MKTAPFLMRYRALTPAIDPALLDENYEYNEDAQTNITEAGELLWRASGYSTSYYTAGKYVPAHTTAGGKRIGGHYRPSRTDRRVGR